MSDEDPERDSYIFDPKSVGQEQSRKELAHVLVANYGGEPRAKHVSVVETLYDIFLKEEGSRASLSLENAEDLVWLIECGIVAVPRSVDVENLDEVGLRLSALTLSGGKYIYAYITMEIQSAREYFANEVARIEAKSSRFSGSRRPSGDAEILSLEYLGVGIDSTTEDVNHILNLLGPPPEPTASALAIPPGGAS